MKAKIMAILMLVAISCQKEKIPEHQVVTDNVESELSAAPTALLNDPNFVNFYQISIPIFNALKKGDVKLPELRDEKITYKECETLAPKLGFKNADALVDYFHKVDNLAPKIAKAHPEITFKQCQDAIVNLNKNSMAPDLYADPCQDGVIGSFIMNVTQCAALGLIPVVGEVLAGTCMIGALSSYNSGMQACAANP